jgi:hypothetical protein
MELNLNFSDISDTSKEILSHRPAESGDSEGDSHTLQTLKELGPMRGL